MYSVNLGVLINQGDEVLVDYLLFPCILLLLILETYTTLACDWPVLDILMYGPTDTCPSLLQKYLLQKMSPKTIVFILFSYSSDI